MQNSVEDLVVQSRALTAPHSSPTGVSVFGRPIHLAADALIARFRSGDLPDFLAFEARHSVGNYATVHETPDETIIITAPGYCGGYVFAHGGTVIVTTLLSTVLARQPDPVAMDSFGLCYLLNHASSSSYHQLPFSTQFRNIRKLPPAAVVRVRAGAVTEYRSYLTLADKLSPPASFEAAMGEVADAYASHFIRVNETPALLFSGGVDSLVIYLALRARMEPGAIRLFTMDLSAHNGMGRAVPVAAKLDLEFEFLPADNLHTDAARAAFLAMMSKDIVNLRGPHIGFIEEPIPQTDLIHGQNMDSIVKVNMTVLQANFEKPFLSRAKVQEAKTSGERLLQYSRFIGNLQFTETYLNDPLFQKESVHFFAMLNKNTVPDPDPGGRGILRGMLSSQYPNLLPRPRFPFDMAALLERDAALFDDFAGQGLSPSLTVDLARFYTYTQHANKRLAGLGLPSGSRPALFAQSGPLISYYVGRTRGLSDASHPKRETYDYAEKMTGMPYSDLLKGPKNPLSDLKTTEPAEDILLRDNIGYLRPEASKVLRAIRDGTTLKHVRAIYALTNTAYQPGASPMDAYTKSRGRQLLNLELILHRAAREKAEQT